MTSETLMEARLEIRAARSDDVERVVVIANEVHALVTEQRETGDTPPVEFSAQPAHYHRALANPELGFFVAQREGQVIGYVLVVRETVPDDLTTEPRADVHELAVTTALRGSGAGATLLDRAEQWAVERGLGLVQLAVWEFNRAAIGLYDRAGYRTIMRKMEKRTRSRSA
jgi:ribosomal protein S18 acetylase RimI-like enzyme